MSEDLRLELRFKNARLYEEIEARFRPEQGATYGCTLAATTIGVQVSTLNGYLTLRVSPWSVVADPPRLTCTAQKIAEFFSYAEDPETLFPISLYRLRIPRLLTKVMDSERFLSFAEARKQKLLPSPLLAEDKETERPGLQEAVDSVLSTLSPQEQTVIRLRFGIQDGQERTLNETARAFNVSPERIRQIKTRALRRLRHPSRSRALRAFIDAP